MKNNSKLKTSPDVSIKKRHHLGLIIFCSLAVIAAIAYIIIFVPFGKYDFSAAPTTALSAHGRFEYAIPLDPDSPWAKFRANELQNGRTPVEPEKIRHSPYCYYFQPKREGDIDEGTFEVCPSGSANAD